MVIFRAVRRTAGSRRGSCDRFTSLLVTCCPPFTRCDQSTHSPLAAARAVRARLALRTRLAGIPRRDADGEERAMRPRIVGNDAITLRDCSEVVVHDATPVKLERRRAVR